MRSWPVWGGFARSARRALANARRLTLRIPPEQRVEIATGMIAQSQHVLAGYWIQFVLSIGIATLGLVLGSNAVVIAAMLISPLMAPLVGLGMGFATGSAALALVSFVRVVLSCVLGVAVSALVVTVLPFHTVTPEIAARTAPTALDLLVAVLCALTASYTTVSRTSNTTSAAAGTAIGVALVPPLCTIGFGLGTSTREITTGSALLFTANVSAIIAITSIIFAVAGFADALRDDPKAPAATRSRAMSAARASGADDGSIALELLRRIFGSRFRLLLRFGLPAVLLAAVFVPLRRALTDVAWDVRARRAVRDAVDAVAPHAIQSDVSVEHRAVQVRLLVVQRGGGDSTLARVLADSIERAIGVVPRLTITTVPSLAAALAARARPAADPAAAVTDSAAAPESVLARLWPRPAAGQLVDWRLLARSDSGATLTLVHLGPPLGGAATELLRRALTTARGWPATGQLGIVDSAITPAPLVRATLGGRWLAAATATATSAAGHTALVGCLVSSRALRKPELARLMATPLARRGGLHIAAGATASFRVALRTCAPADTTRAVAVTSGG